MAEAHPRTESLFWSALALPSPEERARYLAEVCGGDPQLRGQVEELLAAYPKVEGFLEAPASSPDQPADLVQLRAGVGALDHELAIDASDVVRGPGGAVAFIGGAAYVPKGAEAWYEAMQQAAKAIRKTAGPQLVSVEIFDRYEGRGVPEGKVSLAFRLVFQRPERAFTDAEVAKHVERVVGMLAHRFGGELRESGRPGPSSGRDAGGDRT